MPTTPTTPAAVAVVLVEFGPDALKVAEQATDGTWTATGTEADMLGVEGSGDLLTVTGIAHDQFVILASAAEFSGVGTIPVRSDQITARLPLRMIAVTVANGSPSRDQIAGYLPAGYELAGGSPSDVIIVGHDLNGFTAEWTVDRLGSGMIAARIIPQADEDARRARILDDAGIGSPNADTDPHGLLS